MDKIKRLKELTEQLGKASYAYYGKDNPIMSDKEYDDLYDELSKLENELNCVLAGSPTQKVQGFVLDGFSKVEHSKPMLSANKTKDINDIKKFIGNNDHYCSYKLDGLTLVVKYKDGKFIQGITRGNGTVGEDVTMQCRFIKNLPMQISNKHDIELRGECVISWEEFYRINNTLDTPYSHPRNLAAGTLRNLDLNVVKERNLSFVVFEMVTPTFTHKLEGLKALEDLGFECVDRCISKNNNLDDCVEAMQPEFYKYPTDGLIFELNNSELSKSLGSTSHHENCRMALKWKDGLYETVLNDIEWNTSKSGLINPIAVFEPVDLDGAITTKATLHNVSYIEDLQLGIGDTIQIYRANMVIPKIHDNLTRSNTWKLPDKCPNCGGDVEIHNKNGSKTLHCTNPDCSAKLISKLVHFCSKNAINIEGMSEATLQFLIDKGWIKSFKDLYDLNNSTWIDLWKNTNGFGEKSVNKLLNAIEKSKNTTLDRFLYSLSIPLIGLSTSKDISKACNNGDIQQFITIMSLEEEPFIGLNGFGEEMCNSLKYWWSNNKKLFYDLMEVFTFTKENNNNRTDLSGKIFVITGSLTHFKNRDELINTIEKLGGKVSGSVSAKTSFLVNNDTESNSSKNRKAKQLGVPIISEQDFIKIIS